MISNNKTIDVVCAIIKHQNKILVAKRSKNMPHAGFWEFPGGKIEPNETAQQSLIREIKEELGCQIDIVKPLPLFPYQYPDKEVVLHPFICHLKNSLPRVIEHEEIEWFKLEEINDLQWLPADIPIKDYVLKNNSIETV
ncbi:(deoxy)nucleoside triphosphate pyrophosphohydrolase [Labilibacter marinus]|uniref:(deoxy)nucleoside triphosphate pyrophosphohydrolase n=1 Tax=Labilibacter marinus TaxID=1477105 RepID=UPI00082A74B2|nr:(deoxy)nucleoside triphosphate pyrophosphohydrolase [Labilibacter marinus]